MARLARIVVPGVPHHVTQRGNRRQQIFFAENDYADYRDLIAAACAAHRVACTAWCLMPNHVHLILTPDSADGLRAALSEAHRRYSRGINAARGWTGYLWQGRFASYPMDDAHLLAAIRYVELNPVKAGLARRPEDWRWSSARAHLTGAGVSQRQLHDQVVGRVVGAGLGGSVATTSTLATAHSSGSSTSSS